MEMPVIPLVNPWSASRINRPPLQSINIMVGLHLKVLQLYCSLSISWLWNSKFTLESHCLYVCIFLLSLSFYLVLRIKNGTNILLWGWMTDLFLWRMLVVSCIARPRHIVIAAIVAFGIQGITMLCLYFFLLTLLLFSIDTTVGSIVIIILTIWLCSWVKVKLFWTQLHYL